MTNGRWISAIGAAMVVALLVGMGGGLVTGAAAERDPGFDDVRRQTEELVRYNREIRLTPEQQRVMQQALDELPAPCCSDRTATTCCCSCNMARSWWGLAKHLIADQGLGADEVRARVAEWIDFIHPDGYAGDACYRGRCGRPFHRDGCGGMKDGEVAY